VSSGDFLTNLTMGIHVGVEEEASRDGDEVFIYSKKNDFSIIRGLEHL
jgi:hypothetical protein